MLGHDQQDKGGGRCRQTGCCYIRLAQMAVSSEPRVRSTSFAVLPRTSVSMDLIARPRISTQTRILPSFRLDNFWGDGTAVWPQTNEKPPAMKEELRVDIVPL